MGRLPNRLKYGRWSIVGNLEKLLRWLGCYPVIPSTREYKRFEEVTFSLEEVRDHFLRMRQEVLRQGMRPSAYVVGRDVAETLRLSLENERAYVMDLGRALASQRSYGVHPLDRAEFAGVKIIVVPWSTGATIIPE
jgi:hypothetical protein